MLKTIRTLSEEYFLDSKDINFADFGYPIMNKQFSKFRNGEVFVIGARSGSFKTSLALDFGRNIANADKGFCVFMSLEMGGVSLFERLSTMAYSAITNTAFTIDQTVEKLLHTRDGFNNREDIVDYWDGVKVADDGNVDVNTMNDYYQQAKRECKEHISCVVIDYLGYMQGDKNLSKYNSVSAIVKDIKEFAKKENIRVILLVQGNREAGDGSEIMQLNHLRDSGVIEESADFVLGLWQYSKKDDGFNLNDELPIAGAVSLKNRKAQAGITFGFRNKGLSFEEIEIEV